VFCCTATQRKGLTATPKTVIVQIKNIVSVSVKKINFFKAFYDKSTQCRWNDGAMFPDGTFFAEYNKPVFVVQNMTEISLLLNNVSAAFK
jgi:hypothetical protein